MPGSKAGGDPGGSGAFSALFLELDLTSKSTIIGSSWDPRDTQKKMRENSAIWRH